MQSNEGSKHFTGRIKESQSFIHNTVKTYKTLLFCSAILVFLYIYWLFFNVSFDFFLLFTVSKVMGVSEKCCVYLLSPSVMLPASVLMFTDVSSCFCLSLHVVNLSLSVPSVLHFHQSVPFSCLSVTPSHSSSRPLFPITKNLNQWFITLPTLYFIHFPNTCGTVWAYTVPRPCRHNSFICNKAMQLPGREPPLVDVCLSFLSRKMWTASCIHFCFIIHIQI